MEMNRLPEGIYDRSPVLADNQAVVDGLNAAARHTLGIDQVTLEEQLIEFTAPGRSLERISAWCKRRMGAWLAIQVFGLQAPFTPLYCWGRVHPSTSGAGGVLPAVSWVKRTSPVPPNS